MYNTSSQTIKDIIERKNKRSKQTGQCLSKSRLNIAEVIIPSKLIHAFNTIKMKIPAVFFYIVEIKKRILKCICKFKRPQIPKTILKRNKIEGFTLLGIKT